MALVVFLKGVNVGGHRTFRPRVLANQLKRFDAVNVGAAGTFVIRRPVSRLKLRAELTRRLPFEAHAIVCDGRDILRLASRDPFAGQPSGPLIIHFVSVLAKRRRPLTPVPFDLPADGKWCVRVLDQQGRFVLGIYRREMRTIRYLERLEKTFGVTLTTRNWNSILAVARILEEARA